mmetsp:Transcript_21638/g.47531  ORF Transcript_21638/g.47531 Transcript_21638/m.47531 type:complete len:207 (-) Transcript_21638:456-1076(-)
MRCSATTAWLRTSARGSRHSRVIVSTRCVHTATAWSISGRPLSSTAQLARCVCVPASRSTALEEACHSRPTWLCTNLSAVWLQHSTFARHSPDGSPMISVSASSPVGAAAGCTATTMRSLQTICQPCRVRMCCAEHLSSSSISTMMASRRSSATAGSSLNTSDSDSSRLSDSSSLYLRRRRQMRTRLMTARSTSMPGRFACWMMSA